MEIRFIRLIIILLQLSFIKLAGQNINADVFNGCATDELLKANNSLLQFQRILDKKAYDYFISNKMTLRTTTSIEYIPVVVHIVHNGGAENISDAQVITAIADINAKYLQSNNDQIQFCLAQRDPLGNATTGITRDSSIWTTETMEVDDTTLKNINRWPSTCYLNIWVIKEILSFSMGSSVIGYSTFPSSHGTPTDGIVIEAGYFGSSPTNDAVGAHEIGHYLGLYHTFQNGCGNNNCLQDGDQVCDTPPDQTTFAACNYSTNSCNTDANDPSINNPFTTDVADLSDDYMDYSALSCYNQFTTGQYSRMQFFLTTVRSSLLNCLSCTTPCPSPISANITSPNTTTNIYVGATINFTGTVINSNSYQWYLTSGTIISTNLTTSYTFNTAGNYWMKFRALSSNSSLCLDGIDSVLINVMQPVVNACVGSLQFMNSNDAVLLPPPSGSSQYYYNSNGFTWECWVKLTTPFSSYSNALLRPIICAIDPVVYEDICLSFGWQGGVGNVPNTHLAFKVDGANGPSSVSCDYFPTGGFILGTWYHVAGVMDYVNHNTKLYLNGALVDTKTNNATPFNRVIPGQLSWDIILNSGYPNPPLGGNIDEVRIWSRVRTPAEIAANYNQCMTGNEANLLLYYRCNQTAGSVAQDATSNSYDGTLTHQTSWSTQQPTLLGANCSIGCASSCPPIQSNNDTTICLGNSVQLNATSGFTTYTWSPSSGLNNINISNPIATPTITTTYVVTGSALDTNMQACTSKDSVTIKVVTRIIPALNLGSDISLCASGTHTFDAGPGFYSYLWNDGSTFQTYTAYGVGKYWVTVKDSCGGKQSDTVLITLAPTPPLNIRADTLICKGDGVLLTFTPAGIYATYQWSPATNLNCVHCTNPYATPTITTEYFLVASTSTGCTVMDSVIVNVNQNPPTSVNFNTTNPTCGQNNGNIQLNSVTGGTPNYQYNFNNTGFSSNTNYTNLSANTYSLVIVDSLGCVLKTSIVLVDHPGPTGIALTTTSTSVCEPNGAVLLGTVTGGLAPYLYSLNQSAYSSTTEYAGLNVGIYSINVKDSNNCLYTATFTIKEKPEEEEISIPNCFTPNGDPMNEQWFVTGNCIKEFNCTIYNRWGEQLCALTNINDGWDGKYKSNNVTEGTYVYVVDITFTSGKKVKKSGFISVFR